jgi:hypothetical protein
MVLSEIFYTFLVGSVAGLFGLILKYSFESKCKKVTIGCVTIERDVEAENVELHDRLEHNNPIT